MFSVLVLWEGPIAINMSLFLKIISLCFDVLPLTLFQFAYPFKKEPFVLVPQVHTNSIIALLLPIFLLRRVAVRFGNR